MTAPVTPVPAKDVPPAVPDSPETLLPNGMLRDIYHVADGRPGLALNIGKH